MLIDYAADRVFTKTLDIVDPGNCGIRCTSKDGLEYYIVTKTILGTIYIIKFGPVLPDNEALLPDFKLEYLAMDYKDNKIEMDFSKYVNDSRSRNITDLEVIEPEEALCLIPNINQCWQEL